MYSCLARAQSAVCNCSEGKFRSATVCSEDSEGKASYIYNGLKEVPVRRFLPNLIELYLKFDYLHACL